MIRAPSVAQKRQANKIHRANHAHMKEKEEEKTVRRIEKQVFYSLSLLSEWSSARQIIKIVVVH